MKGHVNDEVFFHKKDYFSQKWWMVFVQGSVFNKGGKKRWIDENSHCICQHAPKNPTEVFNFKQPLSSWIKISNNLGKYFVGLDDVQF